MPARTVETERDRDMLLRFIKEQELPFTVETQKGRRRSTEQNRLQRRWINEIAEQTDQTAEEVRAYCKLVIGVPILRAENELFCQRYDEVVKPMPYEQKLAIMAEPLDMPVTRIMTVKQHTQFLDAMARHFAEKGIVLSEEIAA